MANKYLAREDAPFGAEIWGVLDAAMKQAAESLTVRIGQPQAICTLKES